MNIREQAQRTLELVCKETVAEFNCEPEVILFFSGGKDSLTLLDMAAPMFRRVYCVFMYFVEGLEHQEKFLADAQHRYKNAQVIRLPHYGLATAVKYGVYCNAAPDLRITKLGDIERAARAACGNWWILNGQKKNDGLNRRLMLNGYEKEEGGLPVVRSSRKAFPLASWKNKDVLAYVKMKRLPQPINYGMGNPSAGMVVSKDVLVWLRAYYPNDLKKVLTIFPQAETLLFEYDYAKKRQ